MRELSLRRGVVEDAGAIARVQVACWRSDFAPWIEANALALIDEREWAERRRSSLADPERATWVAAEGGRVLAFGECGPVRDARFGPVGEVLALFVHPEAQGAQLGKRLFQKLREELAARGFKALVVKTLRDNPASCAFYEKQGCVRVGESAFDFGGRSYAEAVFRLAI